MITKMRLALGAGLWLLLTAGCNGSVTTEPPGSGGSGGTSATTTGGPTTGSTSATTGSGGICAGFEDAKAANTVTVRFHNNTGVPVYLPAQCAGISYTIKPKSGDDGVTYNFDASCLQTCFDLQSQAPFACGLCAPTSYFIAPGATREIAWNGTGLKYDVAMPNACYAEPQGGVCPQILSAPGGKYDITAFAFSSCGMGCTCNPEGICSGSGEGMQAYADPVVLDFPGQSLVDVDFGVCAFGCPDGP